MPSDWRVTVICHTTGLRHQGDKLGLSGAGKVIFASKIIHVGIIWHFLGSVYTLLSLLVDSL